MYVYYIKFNQTLVYIYKHLLLKTTYEDNLICMLLGHLRVGLMSITSSLLGSPTKSNFQVYKNYGPLMDGGDNDKLKSFCKVQPWRPTEALGVQMK